MYPLIWFNLIWSIKCVLLRYHCESSSATTVNPLPLTFQNMFTTLRIPVKSPTWLDLIWNDETIWFDLIWLHNTYPYAGTINFHICIKFRSSNGWQTPLPKVIDFEPLGALLGPGAPDPDLLRFVLKLSVRNRLLYPYAGTITFEICIKFKSRTQIPYVFWSDVQKVLKFLRLFNRASIRHTKNIEIP